MTAAALKKVEEKILEKYKIADEYYDENYDLYQYRIVDKTAVKIYDTNRISFKYRFLDNIKDEKAEIAQIQLSFSKDATVMKYASKSHWFFSNSETATVPAINVRWLESHEKGCGSLMLAYGVLKMMSKDEAKKIEYSILDDDSDHSIHKQKNLYSKFGYTPVESAERTHKKNTVKLNGPEKQVLLTYFVKKVENYLEEPSRREASAPRRYTRSASRREASPSDRGSKKRPRRSGEANAPARYTRSASRRNRT